MIGGGMSHRGMFRRKISSFCPYLPGLYTESEIDDLVFIDGYIPVYDAAEFDKIRTGASEFMGGCTKWGGSYTTGADKKYVQVGPLNFGSFLFSPILDHTGVYDGNEITYASADIEAVSSGGGLTTGIFGSSSGTIRNMRVGFCNVDLNVSPSNQGGLGFIVGIGPATIENCEVVDCTINDTSNTASISVGYLCGRLQSGGTITDCYTNNNDYEKTATSTLLAALGGMVGQVNSGATVNNSESNSGNTFTTFRNNFTGGFVGISAGTIEDSIARNNVIGTVTGTSTGQMGGFVGLDLGGTYRRSFATGNVSGRFAIGGFCGFRNTSGSVFEECYATGNATSSTDTCGGFIGAHRQNGSITNCYAYGNATQAASINGVGGFVGEMRTGNPTITNCYSIGSATGGGSTAGGFCGKRTNGTITDCYWDTDTSGNATSDGGTGQTTSALQTPTSNTGIYSAWTIPPWDFGTDTEYPTLTTTP